MLDLMAQLFPVDLNYFLLLFLRVSGLIFSSPVFGSRRVPALAKIGFCLVVANIWSFRIRSNTCSCASRSWRSG